MSCATTLQFDDATLRDFSAMKKASGAHWLALKLDGRDLARVVKVGAGQSATFDEFVGCGGRARARPRALAG